MTDSALRRTPLYAEHRRLGARMVPFAGWEMPVQYRSILQEHRAVRQGAGMFDVSHMGEFRIAGPGAESFLQRLTPNDVSTLRPGTAQYSCLLRPDAGIIDDIFIYRRDDDYLVVVNAANIAKVEEWLASQPVSDVEIGNVSEQTALIAVQGPRALGSVQPLVVGDLAALPRRGIRRETVAGVTAWVARTGYTGEDGVEIFCAPDAAPVVWNALLGAAEPILPCGLGARDTLRLEAGNLLYGHDMDESVNPLEAGLGFIVKLDKGDFLGRAALLHAQTTGLRQRLVGFTMEDRSIPRTDCPVEVEGRVVGRVTSGSYAPSLDRSIGLAYVDPALANVGQELSVIIRGRPSRALEVKLPFYRAPRRAATPG
jgi:aminomethyltransferase